MNKVSTVLVTFAAMGLATQASAYEASADVTFNWSAAGSEKTFTASGGGGNLGAGGISNDTFFSAGDGNNGLAYFNADFATPEYLASVGCVDTSGGPGDFRAQYACKIATESFPAADEGPGGQASGTLEVFDTTMTGVLTVVPTNDEGAGPQPGTTEAGGYNIRSADGSPFKNVWYGISDQLTLTVNLTGTFTETEWSITGGTVAFNDPAFQCGVADFSGVLCTPGQLGDGEGSIRSWGNSGDGSTLNEIEVYDPNGESLLAALSGVLANLAIDGEGNITTTQGEYRRGSAQSACLDGGPIRYESADGQVTCGTLVASTLDISGTATIIPVPAAAWLFGSALGLLGWVRRRAAA